MFVPPLIGRISSVNLVSGTVVALALSTSAAFAQCAAPTQTGVPLDNQGLLVVPPTAAASAISGAIGNVNTAFLTQQGSAFVSAPANPAPDQPGGGVWGRAIGGEVTLKTSSTSTSTNTLNATGAVVNNSTTNCANSVKASFAGVQVGADIARLNWSGWNVHLGTTAGYLGSKSDDSFGFGNKYEVPFLGTYVVATKGRFFADLMVRTEYYNITLNNPGLTYFNQPVGAHGYSVSASAGYNFDVGNNWFIEPSAGFIYSNTSVDSFINPGTALLNIPGTVSTNDIKSEIGRLSLRAGTTIATPNVIWQPFGSVSVFHEFAGRVTTNYTSLPNSAFLVGPAFPPGVNPQTFNQTTTTSRVGTYGQYSLGIAGQIVNTGWLGYARVDYRNGSNIDGWTGNAGIRYQFAPEAIAAVMPTKVPVKAMRPAVTMVDWTGFYVGGVLGGASGRTDIGFGGNPPGSGTKPWTLGALGGLELGYNRQFANKWVVGVEGDIVATNLHGARTAGTANGLDALGNSVAFSPAFYTAQDRTNWQSTLTGRLGYAWYRTLFYGKAGLALEDGNVSTSCIFGATGTLAGRSCLNQAGVVSPGFGTGHYTRVGWTIGFGSEFDLGKGWSAKTEYDYLAFGRRSALASDGTTTLTDKAEVSQVKVGLNYRFVPGAVVAKY